MKRITLLFIVSILGCFLLSSASAGDLTPLLAKQYKHTKGKPKGETPPLPLISLSADPVSITSGGSSTLTWTSSNADSVRIDNGIGTVDLNGSLSVAPTATIIYTITATGAGGTATDTVTVVSRSPVISGSVIVLPWKSGKFSTCAVSHFLV